MYSLGELAQIIKAELVGNPDLIICRARPFETAEEGDVTLALSARYTTRSTVAHLQQSASKGDKTMIHEISPKSRPRLKR